MCARYRPPASRAIERRVHRPVVRDQIGNNFPQWLAPYTPGSRGVRPGNPSRLGSAP
jgi:hypothetical protein